MQKLNRWTRALAFAPLFAAVSLLAACDDDPTDEDHDHAEEIVTYRVQIGNSTVVLNEGGGIVSGGPVVIGAGVHNVTVTYLDAAGASLNSELEADFETRIAPANAALVTFARTGAFTGTLTRVAAGSTTLSLSLFHKGEGHDDLGPHTLAITVQ
jgi:hypothetical protein